MLMKRSVDKSSEWSAVYGSEVQGSVVNWVCLKCSEVISVDTRTTTVVHMVDAGIYCSLCILVHSEIYPVHSVIYS